ncbi:MAG: hypothetical protein OSB66_08610 [SAR202 cluster bacterium]|nr:hypothetical protein [SAR202 cluster bacterium]
MILVAYRVLSTEPESSIRRMMLGAGMEIAKSGSWATRPMAARAANDNTLQKTYYRLSCCLIIGI